MRFTTSTLGCQLLLLLFQLHLRSCVAEISLFGEVQNYLIYFSYLNESPVLENNNAVLASVLIQCGKLMFIYFRLFPRMQSWVHFPNFYRFLTNYVKLQMEKLRVDE